MVCIRFEPPLFIENSHYMSTPPSCSLFPVLFFRKPQRFLDDITPIKYRINAKINSSQKFVSSCFIFLQVSKGICPSQLLCCVHLVKAIKSSIILFSRKLCIVSRRFEAPFLWKNILVWSPPPPCSLFFFLILDITPIRCRINTHTKI